MEAAIRYPGTEGVVYSYGTAGFRMRAKLLSPLVFRMGGVAFLRSLSMSGQFVGAMITASHNPGADNGLKLVDPSGEMLAARWEQTATVFANTPNEGLDAVFQRLLMDVDESETTVR